MCMPHHSGGGNATKVRRRSTCRNSLRDIFLHDPFLHHLKHAYGFLVLLQNAPKIQFGFRAFWNSAPKLWNVLRQTTRETDFSATFRRRLKSHLFSDWLSFFECLLDSLCAVTFLCLPKTVSMILFSFSFEKKKKSPSGHWSFKSMEPIAIEMDITIIIIIIIIIITIITVMATLSRRKRRRQVHYWLYSQLAFCDQKLTNILHHARRRDANIWLEKQVPFCVMCCFRGLLMQGREVLVSELGKLRGKDNCGLYECSQVKFKSPINGGCSYTTASSRVNCTSRSSHVRTVSSGSENCSHSVKLRFQCNM